MLRMSDRQREKFKALGITNPTNTFLPKTAVSARPVATPSRPSRQSTGPCREVVDLVLDRDGHACSRCGWSVGNRRGEDYSIQHRVARGNGGTSRPELGLTGNLIMLCGSATSAGGCHTEVEGRSVEDRLAGYWLLRDFDGKPTDPTAWPVHHARLGWVLLNNVGGWTRWEVSA